jgi:hypothetical protein
MPSMSRDDHERELFEQAFRPPGAEPYDVDQPFDAEKLLGGFTMERREVPVDPDSPLGKAMARVRESWGEAGPPDPNDFVFPESHPVDE